MVFLKSDIEKNKKPPAGMLATEVRIGDAPTPPFPMETHQKIKKSDSSSFCRSAAEAAACK